MILIISTCSIKLHEEEFIRPITQILEEENKNYEIINYKSEFFVDNYSKIIICGTALKDFDYLNYNYSWIKEFKNPILGICAGAQIISKEFGEKLKEGSEIGLVEIKKVCEDQILEEVNLNEIYSLHNKYSSVPKNFKLILANQIPQLYRKNNIICSLFHPEVRNKELIRNFLKIKS